MRVEVPRRIRRYCENEFLLIGKSRREKKIWTGMEIKSLI